MSFRPPSDPAELERIKQERREERARRKAALEASPRYQAQKQQAKDRRRAASEAAKARRKAMKPGPPKR